MPLDYILGRTDTITETNSHNTISGNNNVIGDGNTINGDEKKLSKQEIALIETFSKLDAFKQARLLTYLLELEKEV